MGPASSAAIRAVFLGASAAVHTLALVAIGHSRGPTEESAREVAVLVDESSPVRSERARPEAMAKSAVFVSRPAHTHSYPVPLDHDARPHDPSLVHLPVTIAAASPRTPPPIAEAAPDVLQALPPTPARFVLVVGSVEMPHGGPQSSMSTAGVPPPGSDTAPLSEAYVSSPARLVGSFSPVYPQGARAREAEADVVLLIVVTTTGTVAEARVLERAGFGFDETALNAMRGAHFVPAQREGRAVAVRMRWTVAFRLR